MSDADRIELLERLGYVPDDPHLSDYVLAQKTSWWGRPLAASDFWTNRVVWLDGRAQFEARRRGRGYPPMPYEDVSVRNKSDEDQRGDGAGLIHFVYSSREGSFWDKFAKTHPLPPEQIEAEQLECARGVLRTQYILETDRDYAERLRLTPEKSERNRDWASRQAQKLGFPIEAFSQDALFWSHVLHKREEYLALFGQGTTPNARTVSNFFRNVYVDHNYITDALTDDQMAAAIAWKISYLRRLREEGTYASYIDAYMDAWDIEESFLVK